MRQDPRSSWTDSYTDRQGSHSTGIFPRHNWMRERLKRSSMPGAVANVEQVVLLILVNWQRVATRVAHLCALTIFSSFLSQRDSRSTFTWNPTTMYRRSVLFPSNDHGSVPEVTGRLCPIRA